VFGVFRVHAGGTQSIGRNRLIPPNLRSRELDSGHGEVRRKLLGHTDCVMAVDASAFSNRIAAGSMDRSLRVWDFFLPQRRVERPDPEGPARELCPLGCGERIAQCDASSHASDHCQLREVQCQDCAEKMPARVLAAHAAADCALRRFACVCGDRVSLLPY